MNPREYAAMFAVEDRHWWYRGVRREIERALARARMTPRRWLDAGCGTGGLHAGLCRPDGVGVDVSLLGLRLARSRGLTRLSAATVNQLPFRDGSLDCVTSIDVLAHRQVEIAGALREFARCLTPDGLLVLQLPAFDALRGGHDDAVWTERRFRKTEVEALLRSTGFRLRESIYRNSLLFPLAAVRRLLGRRSSQAEPRSEVAPVPAPLNSLLFGALELDSALRRAGLKLPFGLSVFCVASKANEPERRVG